MKFNIIISGEGGQGIQTIAKVISKSAFLSSLWCNHLPSFGVEQRGTPSLAFLSVSKKESRFSRFENCNLAFILQKRAIKNVEPFLTPNSEIVFDSSTISPSDLPKFTTNLFGLPATKYANEKFHPKSFNIIVIGYLAKLLKFNKDLVWKQVREVLGSKISDKDVLSINKAAFDFGYDMVLEKNEFTTPTYKPKHKSVLHLNQEKKSEVVPNRCKSCGICILKCPVGAISFSDDLGLYGTPIPKVNLDRCILCGNCRHFCPDGAIIVEKK